MPQARKPSRKRLIQSQIPKKDHPKDCSCKKVQTSEAPEATGVPQRRYFDILKVQIDDTKQHTKLQGAQTAEQVSKEAKRVSPDDAQMALRQITVYGKRKNRNASR
jgi:hypothetical protein